MAALTESASCAHLPLTLTVPIEPTIASSREAKFHIEQIRREYSLDGHDRLAKIISNALDMQELLQNADDNHYDVPVPTLRFTYTPRRLRVDCNERGFQPANVEAICTIRGSTKTADDQASYTGEKGIGFKSVFRVADVVWISSRGYRFKFDKNAKFGTVAPQWAEHFPVPTAEGYTTFYLELSERYDAAPLIQELAQFDAQQLLFLRRLRLVEIDIQGEDGQNWGVRRIHRLDEKDGFGNLTTTLKVGEVEHRYLVRKHRVTNLPEEPKRRHQPHSDLVLALPLADGLAEPVYQPMIFAGLPIGDAGGLKFLLQGDFLLTASRLHIDTSLCWNKTLRDAVSEAFLDAVRAPDNNPHQYTWPGFLSDGSVLGFFHPTVEAIRYALQASPCLESAAGVMAKPSELVYADPQRYCDAKGNIFTLGPATRPMYLSAKYPSWAIDAIKSLGVQAMSDKDFVNHFSLLLADKDSAFWTESSDWHGQLSRVLLSLMKDSKIRVKLLSLPIVPLGQGKWVSATDDPKPVFFSEDLERAELSTNDWLPVVDPEAAVHKDRRALYQALGIATIDKTRLCEYICQQHASPDFKAEKYTIAQLVTHAKTLFESSWAPPSTAIDLWFATADDKRLRGSNVYLGGVSNRGSAAQKVAEYLKPTIHPDYLTCYVDNDERDAPPWRVGQGSGTHGFRHSDWMTFLEERLQVSAIPRLMETNSSLRSERVFVSPCLKQVLHHCPVADWLQVLNDNWRTYSKWLEPDASTQGDALVQLLGDMDTVQLLSEIGKTRVSTTRGHEQLRNTFIPDIDSLVEDVPLPVLDIALPIDKATKHRLSLFGVKTEDDASFYIACLQAMATQASPNMETLEYIYEQLQAKYSTAEDMIDDAFFDRSLIYAEVSRKPGEKTPRGCWIDLLECVDRKIDLGAQYPRCDLLFKCLATTVRLNIGAMVEKAAKINTLTRRHDAVKMYTSISDVLAAMPAKKAANVVKLLLTRAVFPVVSSKTSKARGLTLMAPNDKQWFIADRQHLRKGFLGRLPILDLSPAEIEAADPLLKALGLASRKLSVLVDCQSRPTGQLEYSASATWFFRSRAPYIKALLPANKKREAMFSLIRWARVSYAKDVSRVYTLKKDAVEVTSAPEQGEVACSVTNNNMQIFLAEGFNPRSHHAVTEVVEMISEEFAIDKPLELRLLHLLFGEKDLDIVLPAFVRHGFRVDDEDGPGSCLFTYEEVNTVPSPFEKSGFVDDESHVSSDKAHFGVRFTSKKGPYKGPDRRLPLLEYTTTADVHKKKKELAFEPDHNMQYLGECIVSKYFELNLGSAYEPKRDWKSSLRIRAGLDISDANGETCPFVMEDADTVTKVTDLLVKSGVEEAQNWQGSTLRYHFELAVSDGGFGDCFSWSWEQLERCRNLQLYGGEEEDTDDVVILIQICNVYTAPSLRFLGQPWDLLWSGCAQFANGSVLKMAIDLNEESSAEDTPVPESEEAVPWTGSNDHAAQVVYPVQPYPDWTAYSHGYVPYPVLAPVQWVPSPVYWPPQYMGWQPPPNNQLQWPNPGYDANWSENSEEPWSLASNLVNTTEWSKLGRYAYRPLRKDTEMRLFTLFPGKGEELVRGVIHTVRFADAGPFAALSYVWGEKAQPKYKVFTPEGILHIHAALFQVLQRIRNPAEAIMIWVDAICINQEDDEEKAHQVQLLPRIFLKSACTFAFLGREASNDAAIEMLMQVKASSLPDSGDNSRPWPKNLPKCPDSWEGADYPPANDPVWPRLANLLDHEWFRRVWIIQEAVASPVVKFVCDKYTIDWDDMVDAMRLLEDHKRLSEDILEVWSPLRTLDDLRVWNGQRTRWSILLLLETFRSARSTLKRDRFFAMLGIASDGNLPDFAPDYKSPLEVVVRSFARALVSQGMGIHLLYGGGISTQPNRFPSWIPDWTVAKPVCLHESQERGVLYLACGDDDTSGQITYKDDALHVTGYRVDRVKLVSHAANHRSTWRSYFAEVEKMLGEMGRSLTESRESGMWQVPVAGANHAPVAFSESLDLYDSFKAFQKLLKKMQYTKKYSLDSVDAVPGGEASLYQKSRSYMELLETLEGLRFAITEENRCGLVPGNTQPGEDIVIVSRGVVPFCFRKGQQDECQQRDAYQLVGQCFIQGIMDGEALQDASSVEFAVY